MHGDGVSSLQLTASRARSLGFEDLSQRSRQLNAKPFGGFVK
jgi:hypothetical protein